MHEIDARGSSERQQRRATMSGEITKTLKGGENVAVFTSVDVYDHRYWVAKVVGEPWETPGADKCPISGEKFDANERLVKVQYYDRVGRQARVFRFRPELGTFWVRTSMLRALVKDEQLAPCGIDKVELCEELHKTIVDRIVNLFNDKEA